MKGSWRRAAVVLAVSLWLAAASPVRAEPELFDEARQLIRDHSLTPLDEDQALARALRAYLGTLDPWSGYLSAAERQSLAERGRPDYFGVGMDIVVGAGGEVFCVPYDEGPASRAGFQSGDRLLAVDGRGISGEPPEVLVTRIRGPAGTEVELTVADALGETRSVRLPRAAVSRPLAEVQADGLVLKIRIYRFETGLADLLAEALTRHAGHRRVILDLRGNVGGELSEAVKSAALFVPPAKVIVQVAGRAALQGRDQPRVYRSGPEDGAFSDRRIVIWQDRLSASAAEILIAALTENGLAVSVGFRSFGKGVSQSTFPAGDGGLFLITTGRLIGPSGRPWNEEGLEPRLLLRSSGSDGEYYRRTEEAFEL